MLARSFFPSNEGFSPNNSFHLAQVWRVHQLFYIHIDVQFDNAVLPHYTQAEIAAATLGKSGGGRVQVHSVVSPCCFMSVAHRNVRFL
jgi:hypothetical protein